jgi:heavy metal sensor kinase
VSLPIRVRLTAWYAALLAAIVVAFGAFLVLQLRSDLRQTIDRELSSASPHIASGYREGGTEDFLDESTTALPRSGAAAQVVDARGRVHARYGDGVGAAAPLAPAGARADALAGRSRLMTVTRDPGGRRYRALVSRLPGAGPPLVLVVAESLQGVEESVRRVLVLLLLGGPAALAGTALVGWWLARKALRPVGRMTSRAAGINIDHLHERVPVPPARDEIGHLAVTLNAMLDRLEQGVDEKRRLVADASHELRSPLAVMRAELDVSLRDGDLPATAREVLESVREEVHRLSRTADNLLILAQVDAGRLALLTAPVRLRDASGAAARALRPLADAKGVRLEVEGDGDGDGHDAEADPERLHQVLTNFIHNAITFTAAGGEVRVADWRRGDEVGVTVTDDGPGIPAEARAHVFDRFYRVDSARGRDAGGSGLGLAICSEIARAHGGRVWADSGAGGGSAFSLALPATDAVKTAAPRPSAARPRPRASPAPRAASPP